MKEIEKKAHSFRIRVNKHTDILIAISGRTGSYNYWNMLCASMDWIDVASGYIKNYTKVDASDNTKNMNLYTYISSIDVIFKCVTKMARMVLDEQKIFSGQADIFNDNIFNFDDNNYFRHIRAAFGAHTVELDKGQWGFSSWPSNGFGGKFDCSVYLYSEKLGSKDIEFGFKYSQLEEFLKRNIDFLDNIVDGVKLLCSKHKATMRTTRISIPKNLISFIDMLVFENKRRMANDYYDSMLKHLKSFLETEFTCTANRHAVEAFRKIVIASIKEIRRKLQNMVAGVISTDKLIDPDYEYSGGFGYAFGKLSESVFGYRYYSYGLYDDLIRPYSGCLEFDYSSDIELYWLLIISMNIKNGNLNFDNITH